MKKGNSYSLIYAGAVGLLCALVLTSWGRFTDGYIRANEEAEKVRHIMDVLSIEFDSDAGAEELLDIFQKKVRSEELAGLEFYSSKDLAPEDAPAAVQFSGSGLWGPIEGFLALEPDWDTIRAITIYRQEETPGLGGEIASERFQDQFRGRSITDGEGRPGLRIIGDRDAEESHEVDAITGATMTCNRLEEMINKTIRRIVEEVSNDGR